MTVLMVFYANLKLTLWNKDKFGREVSHERLPGKRRYQARYVHCMMLKRRKLKNLPGIYGEDGDCALLMNF